MNSYYPSYLRKNIVGDIRLRQYGLANLSGTTAGSTSVFTEVIFTPALATPALSRPRAFPALAILDYTARAFPALATLVCTARASADSTEITSTPVYTARAFPVSALASVGSTEASTLSSTALDILFRTDMDRALEDLDLTERDMDFSRYMPILCIRF